MSKETLQALNTNTLIGFTTKRGNAWHYRQALQGGEPNHYPRAIPVEDVRCRLFNWEGVTGSLTATHTRPDGTTLTHTDPNHIAVMRSDTGAVLGTFASSYRIHQYDQWLVRNVEQILDADLAIGSAGLLNGGGVAWVQIEMEETVTAAEGIEFRPFLTAATSMDGTLATTYLTGAQVVVCDNTLSAALNRANERIKIKHSRLSLGRLAHARDALKIVHGIADTFSAQVAALIDTKVTDEQWSHVVAELTATDSSNKAAMTRAADKARSLHQVYRHDERAAPWAGTAYGAIAAVNTWTHHIQPIRTDRATRNMNQAVRGGFDKLDQRTLELLATA